jgi:cytochrome c peroxidase
MTNAYRQNISIFLTAWLSLTLCGTTFAFDVIQALPAQPLFPGDNPSTAAKIELGKQLFFDPRLSIDGRFSCNVCHNLAAGGDDDGAVGRISQQRLNRSAPTLWNVSHMSTYYWDARARSLEEQATDHLLDPRVMAMGTADALVQRLNQIAGYRQAFAGAFNENVSGKGAISMPNIAKAIAAFERTLVTPNSAFDRYVKGDKKAISESAQRGFKLFDDTGCLSCHFGVNFAGPAPGPALNMGDGFYELFPNHLGSRYDEKYDLASDIGRYQVTLDERHKYMWRVPGLRNIELTAPYFHNGKVASLDEAVRIMALTQLKTEFNQQQVNDVVAFLKTLTGEIPSITLPRLPETEGLSLMVGNDSAAK